MQPNSPRERVAATIRAELARQRKTGSALARHLDMPQSSASRRLHGHVPFTVDELHGVAAFLDVPVSTLLGEAATAGSAA